MVGKSSEVSCGFLRVSRLVEELVTELPSSLTVAIARALVRRPRIMIMDEGSSALDSQTEGQLQKAIAAIQKETGMTVV